MADNQTTHCPHGFNGTLEQLVRALRHHAKRESLSTYHVKDAAAWYIERLEAAMRIIVGTSCDDPSTNEAPEARLQRISDMARTALDIPL